MNTKALVGLAVAGGLVAGYFARDVAHSLSPPAPAAVSAAGASGARAAGQRGVEAASPTSGLVRPVVASTAVAHPAKATLGNEFLTTKQLKGLYDRLANSPEGQSADGQFTLYRILRACANVTDRRGPQPLRPPSEEQRQAFVANLPDKDPNRDKRLASYEQLGEDRCVGLSGITTTEAELTQKLQAAALAGSPAAKVAQVEREMWAERRTPESRGGPTLTDAQIESLRTALASKDPEAIASAGRVLASSFRDLTVRIGPEQLNADASALNMAATMLACGYGYACGENNLRILNGCAYQGHCEAGNLPDYLQYYAGSPYAVQLQQQYTAALRTAIETGDWSAITFTRGPTVAASRPSPWGRPGR